MINNQRGVPSGLIRGGEYWWGSGGLNQNMTIPRQLVLGEVIGQKKGKVQPKPRPETTCRPSCWDGLVFTRILALSTGV
tara:strand:+ start:334 stop:570 length:237 start_codon:yes stop_codon:yes gene_type:complete